MADREGNVLHVPGTSTKAEIKGDEILGSYVGLRQKGLTLKQAAGTVLETGTVLKVSTTAKKYAGAAKADVASAVGILRKGVDISAADTLANVVLSGAIKGSKVRYTDDSDGLSTAELQSLAEALGGRYDPVHDYLILV
jgi:hypothetical protein